VRRYSPICPLFNQVRYRPDLLRTLFGNAAVPLRILLVSVLINPPGFAIALHRTPTVSVLSVRLLILHFPQPVNNVSCSVVRRQGGNSRGSKALDVRAEETACRNSCYSTRRAGAFRRNAHPDGSHFELPCVSQCSLCETQGSYRAHARPSYLDCSCTDPCYSVRCPTLLLLFRSDFFS